jgi:hypothetical protein
MTVTITPSSSSRTWKIEGTVHMQLTGGAVGSDAAALLLVYDGGTLRRWDVAGVPGLAIPVSFVYTIFNMTAAVHAVKLQIQRNVGAGTWSTTATSPRIGQMTISDIGNSS